MKSQIDPHTLKVLEFDKITALLAKLASSELGNRVCQSITPQTDFSLIRDRLNEVTEMKSIVGIHGLLPFHGLRDIIPILGKADPAGAFLTPRELWEVLTLARSSHEVRIFLKKDNKNYPAIDAWAQKIKNLKTLEKELSIAIDEQGEILDSASRGLERIRGKIKKVRRQIKSVLENILDDQEHAPFIQEKFITLRHDRYVIPVKSDFKSQLPGVVHDQSKKQTTCFIEPLKVVELNNELTLLKDGEKQEEIRILRRLTDLVREKKEALLENQRYLGILDSIQARARMSEKMGAQEPELVDRREIRLLQARHPILLQQAASDRDSDFLIFFDKSQIVPIDLVFPSDSSTLIITGPNMGGKTAALKTLGLLTLMVQAGMHIPVAEGSQLTAWEAIFADIGDEQNLEQSVSTFSSHINQLNRILQQANEKSLVLLDEVGAGTDPQEGSALVLAIMDALRTRKAKAAVTTHLDLLKAYATSFPDVMNVSVGFDSVTLQPTFKLLYGVPGNSRAIETAARLGVDTQILKKAKAYLKESNRRIIELIEHLENTVQSILAIKNEFEKVLLSASRYEKVIITLAKKIEAKKEAIFTQIEGKARALFREAESELKKRMKSRSSLDKKSIKRIQRETSEIRRHLIDNLTEAKKPKNDLGALQKGARLVLGKDGKEGQIVNVDYGANKVEILIDNMRLKASIDELRGIQGVQITSNQKPKGEAATITLPFSKAPSSFLPLNLIGLTVDEALPIIDKALDQALLCGEKDFRIIHGLGTGRLRQAIHDYLKQQPRVKKFYPGEPLEGGAGITIVRLEA